MSWVPSATMNHVAPSQNSSDTLHTGQCGRNWNSFYSSIVTGHMHPWPNPNLIPSQHQGLSVDSTTTMCSKSATAAKSGSLTDVMAPQNRQYPLAPHGSQTLAENDMLPLHDGRHWMGANADLESCMYNTWGYSNPGHGHNVSRIWNRAAVLPYQDSMAAVFGRASQLNSHNIQSEVTCTPVGPSAINLYTPKFQQLSNQEDWDGTPKQPTTHMALQVAPDIYDPNDRGLPLCSSQSIDSNKSVDDNPPVQTAQYADSKSRFPEETQETELYASVAQRQRKRIIMKKLTSLGVRLSQFIDIYRISFAEYKAMQGHISLARSSSPAVPALFVMRCLPHQGESRKSKRFVHVLEEVSRSDWELFHEYGGYKNQTAQAKRDRKASFKLRSNNHHKQRYANRSVLMSDLMTLGVRLRGAAHPEHITEKGYRELKEEVEEDKRKSLKDQSFFILDLVRYKDKTHTVGLTKATWREWESAHEYIKHL